MIGYSRPYGGYLEQVTKDYFTQEGLRSTHNSVLTDMPGDLAEQVKPWLADTVAWPPLLGELGRATLGAWGNYLGDTYNRGEIVDNDIRRKTATASTLTMGLLGVTNDIVRTRHRNPESVVQFFDKLGNALQGSAIDSVDTGLKISTQLTAFDLARYMSWRLGLANTPLGEAIGKDVEAIKEASERQFASWHTMLRN